MKQRGHWIDGSEHVDSGLPPFDDCDPRDDSLLARLSRADASTIASAVASADAAWRKCGPLGPSTREAWLLRTADLLHEQRAEFVDLLIAETGSPLTKAQREIDTAVRQLRAAAGLPRRISGRSLPTDVDGRLSVSVRRPLGVIAGITPFNVPLIKGVKHSAFPLATGNAVVLLPSPDAPLIALKLAELYTQAGVPDGMVNVVTGFGQEIGDALTGDPRVRMVTFTGSTKTGRHIAARCGRFGKRVTLEMGGSNPLIVLKDASLPLAVQNAVVGAFLYQGQICMSSSRLIVERAVAEPFIDALVERTQQLGMGDLQDPTTMIGPIINSRQRTRIQQHLQDAVDQGAKVLCGNEWQQHRLAPTILMDVSPEAILRKEETFGPVTSVYVVEDAAEALHVANDTSFGLVASVFTQDLAQAMAFAEDLQAGMVHVNAGTIQEEAHVPFGGLGDSGFGREGTDAAIEELTEWKWITLQPTA